MDNQVIIDYFKNKENSAKVKQELFELYELAVKSQEFSNEPEREGLERILVYNSIIHSIYQIFIHIDQNEILQFGIEVKKYSSLLEFHNEHKNSFKKKLKPNELDFRKIKNFTVKDTSFNAYSISFEMNSKKVLVLFVVPAIIQDVSNFTNSISEILKNSILSEPIESRNQIVPTFSEFKEELQDSIINFPYSRGFLNGVIAHFYMEDLKLYYNYMGEQFTSQIITEIRNTIESHLKKTDLLFTVNRRSYITYLPDCDVNDVSKRFKDVFFRIDPLIIKYQLDFYQVNSSNVNDIDFFDKILSSELRI